MGLRTWCRAPAGRICTEPAGYPGANKSQEGRVHREAADIMLQLSEELGHCCGGAAVGLTDGSPSTPHTFACCGMTCYMSDLCAWRTWRHYGKIPSRGKEIKHGLQHGFQAISWLNSIAGSEGLSALAELLLHSDEACAALIRSYWTARCSKVVSFLIALAE